MNTVGCSQLLHFELHEINVWSCALFAGMAPGPVRRRLLESAHPGGATVGVGAVIEGEGAGLLLAQGTRGGSFVIRTLHVLPQHRGRGLEAALLHRFEELARARGAPSLTWMYPIDGAASRFLVPLLTRRGWSVDESRLQVFDCSGTMLGEPWLAERPLPRGVHCFAWSELSAGRRAELEAWLSLQDWVPPGLAPRSFPDIEACHSFGLSRDGEVSGWILTQRVSPSILHYASLAVRPGGPHRGLGAWLIAVAIRRQERAMGRSSIGTFTVAADNFPMLRVVERRLKRHLISRTEMTLASKTLSPGRVRRVTRGESRELAGLTGNSL